MCALEVEKKYRLRPEEHARLPGRLAEVGATFLGRDFEVNTIYGGAGLDPQSSVLRLRRTETRSILTYKERGETGDSAIRRNREDETEVGNGDAMAAILDALGYHAALVYEKRRSTWRLSLTEILVDELPFGLFLEIEGDEESIRRTEQLLNLAGAEAELATYPELAAAHGVKRGQLIEARFGGIDNSDP